MKETGINQSTLKYIGILSMLFDHIGLILQGHSPAWLYDVLRLSGRLAFPIFCFCLVEGFLHTSDVKKYMVRLGIFALVSEVPFDLLVHGSWFYLDGSNVMVTLLIGLVVIYGISLYGDDSTRGVVITFLIITLGMGAAVALHSDYSWMGVLLIAFFYICRCEKMVMYIAAALLLLSEGNILAVTAPLALVGIAFYNGQKGRQPKYLFYLFYPAHMLILAIIGYFL